LRYVIIEGCEEEGGWVEVIVLNPRLPEIETMVESEMHLIEIDE